jgi:TolB protein
MKMNSFFNTATIENVSQPAQRAPHFRRWIKLFIALLLAVVTVSFGRASEEFTIVKPATFGEKPIPIAVEGFSGEALGVLNFDLAVQGFTVVPESSSPQYVVKGSSEGSVAGSLTDAIARQTLFSRTYSGAGLRRQAHALADDIVTQIRNTKPIGGTKIAYKSQAPGGNGEIFVADFDGHDAQAVTSDNAIVAKPAWVPGHLALYYTSYARSNPDIFYHSLSSGQRRVISSYSGLNTGAAVSPDGSKVAMILSKSGSPNVWTCNADGSDPKRVSTGIEDSSPCWSPDGQWICYAAKANGRRILAKIPAGGGAMARVSTTGAPNPTEPDWSPDNKWIAFTSQSGSYFNICVVAADGSVGPIIIVPGQNPSWAPNSRTLIFNRGLPGRQNLAAVDVFTAQSRDCHRASGSNSEPSWGH